jgi:hypothetical protein
MSSLQKVRADLVTPSPTTERAATRLTPSRFGRLLTVGHDGSLVLFAFAVFFPYLVGLIAPLPYLIAAPVWLYALTEILRRWGLGWRIVCWLTVPPIVAIATWMLYRIPREDRGDLVTLPGAVRDYALLPIVAIVAGLVAARDPRITRFIAALRVFASITAILALTERFLGFQLFPGNIITGGFGKQLNDQLIASDGSLRAVVATDHPLILGLLLTMVLPFVARRPITLLRVIEAALLLAANWVTDSIGPFWLGVVVVLVGFLWPKRWRGKRLMPTWVAAVLFIAGFGFFLWATVNVWSLDIYTGEPGGDGARYRTALLALIPQIILDGHPFGYGLYVIPQGTLWVDAGTKQLDVSKTVDSQMSYQVIQTGIVGLIAFWTVGWIAIRGIVRGVQPPLTAYPLFIVTLLGAIVCLTCWPTVAVLWEFLAAAAVFAIPAALSARRTKASAIKT